MRTEPAKLLDDALHQLHLPDDLLVQIRHDALPRMLACEDTYLYIVNGSRGVQFCIMRADELRERFNEKGRVICFGLETASASLGMSDGYSSTTAIDIGSLARSAAGRRDPELDFWHRGGKGN